MSQSISVVEPVRQAIETTRQMLFAPFDMVKWLGLGFTAWLAMLGNNGNPLANLCNLTNDHAGAADPFQAAWGWTLEHMLLAILIASCIGIFILVLSLVVAWINSRGKFMFLDNVIHGRAEIAEPWGRTRPQGNSYFLFSICLGLAALTVMAVILLIGGLIAMPDIKQEQFGAHAVIAIGLGGLLFMLYLVVLGCVATFLEDFIVPIMALRSCRVLAAWSEFFALFKAHTGTFILYLLFKTVLAMAVGVICLIFFCCLCCVMWIPYVSTVILLPFIVFMRCYSLHFLEQFGARYQLFQRESREYLAVDQEPPPTPA